MTIVATYASAGEGHRRAAEAIAGAAQQTGDLRVELRDCLAGSAPWFRWTYTRGYLHLARSAPSLWGLLYGTTDRWGRYAWFQRIRRWHNARHEQLFAEWLVATQPDVVAAAHFFPVEVATALKRCGRLRSKVVSVITDWLPHAFWICPGVDRYAVASEATRQALLDRGVPPRQIVVTGIPIDWTFATHLDRAATATRLGLNPRQFTILVGSGGFGLGPVEQLVRALGALREPCQLLIVAGHNERLRRRIESLQSRLHHTVTAHGFVPNMGELMAVSDLMISKPGGLTCAEAMARGLPMMMVAPIPGQEARNATVLTQAGAAVPVRHIGEAAAQIGRLRAYGALTSMRKAAHRLARPHAAAEVVQLSRELANER